MSNTDAFGILLGVIVGMNAMQSETPKWHLIFIGVGVGLGAALGWLIRWVSTCV